MLKSNKISFFSAVLINVNIVIGSAFFLGAPLVSQKAGYLAPLAWLTCSLLLLPFVMIFSRFAYKYPEAGGVFVYSGKELGRFWGYLGGWFYFIGTTAGNGMVLRAFATYLYGIPGIHQSLTKAGIPQLWLELFLVLFFTWLSLRNIQVFAKSQLFFSSLKLIPLIALIVGAAALFSPATIIQSSSFNSDSVFSVMSTVLFAFIGIEACSAIIDQVDHAKKQGFKVILTAFGLISTIYAIAQFLIVGLQGQSTDNPFLAVLPRLLGNAHAVSIGNQIIYASLLLSFLGGFYGMFYVNSWNLHAMAEDKTILGYTLWQKLNIHNVPWTTVLLQSIFLIAMIFTSHGSDLLVLMGDLGVVLAYGLTAIAFLRLHKGLLGAAGICSVLLLSSFLLEKAFSMGWIATLPFWIMLLGGIILYRRKE